MRSIFKTIVFLSILSGFHACKKDSNPSDEPRLIVRIVVDSNQIRLGNLGLPSTIPAGNAGQSPRFNKISSHYLELAPNMFTQLGQGAIIYHAPETTAGGANAIDFSKSIVVTPGQDFLSIPLSQVAHGTYEWVRASLSYQNYDIDFLFNNLYPMSGTVASFVGFNTYLTSYTIKTLKDSVFGNRLQGYWSFETNGLKTNGQSPANATTVPNPLASTSPIPAGSCVVTGQFSTPLVITGNETKDIIVTLSLSVNKSFEWVDTNGNGQWDVAPGAAEQVVDMGLRGLIPSHTN
jgi:hypothetical protein